MNKAQRTKARKMLDKLEAEMIEAINDRIPPETASDATMIGVCNMLEQEQIELEALFEKIREHLDNQE